MHDEIRITVIATGFDDFMKKKESLGNVTHLGGYRAGRFIDAYFYAPGKNKTAMLI